MKLMIVRNLMTEPAICCRSDETLEAAVDRMREHDVGALAVIDDEGRIQAVITDRDACLTACELKKELGEIRVQSAMSSLALVCEPDDSIGSVEDIMQVNHVRRLPVVDPTGRVLGMLSLDDIASEALREIESGVTPPEISTEEVTRTLAEVSRPAHRGKYPIPPGSEAMPRTT